MNIADAVRYIREGRVIAFPTGTLYGLAVDATQGHALARLSNIKHRPQEKAYTVFLDPELWGEYFTLTKQERAFLERYANTALTLLVRPKDSLAHLAKDGLVGLRVIDNPIMAEFAREAALPLTATSANISGEDACYDAASVEAVFPKKVGTTYDLSLAGVLDGGALRPGMRSTIVKLEGTKPVIIREGSLVLS